MRELAADVAVAIVAAAVAVVASCPGNI